MWTYPYQDARAGVLVNDRTGERDPDYLAATYADLRAGHVRFLADTTETGPPAARTARARRSTDGAAGRGARRAESARLDLLRERARERGQGARTVRGAALRSVNGARVANGIDERWVGLEIYDVDSYSLYGWVDLVVKEDAARRVTQQEVYDWFGNECSGVDVTTEQGRGTANLLFTDVIANAFDVPLEGNRTDVRPADGYVVENGYVVKIFETKNVGGFAFPNPTKIQQAKDAIDRLVAHREALRRNAIDEYGNASLSVTAPTFIVVTTSPEDRLDYNNEVLDHAREKGVNLYVYHLYERYFVDWFLRGERLNLVFGGYDDWYVGVPLGEVPEWLDWIVPGLEALRDLDEVDVRMDCEPEVVRQGAPDPPGGY